MKKFFAIAAFLALFAAPVLAEDTVPASSPVTETVIEQTVDPVVTQTTTVEETTVIDGAPVVETTRVETAPVVETTTITETVVEEVPSADVVKATADCTAETNEKVKLPEGASEAEQAQWNAALAECLKNKGVVAAE